MNTKTYRAVCKEALKAVQLIVTKVEGMIAHTPDTKKVQVTLTPTLTFTRTSPQEHNTQVRTYIYIHEYSSFTLNYFSYNYLNI
jgi:hypothetical protein